jgi:GT2 family glycosyltransferase
MGEKTVSIVFVNYKTPELLHNAIASVVKYTEGCSYEIIVVDNHSEDNSKALIKSSFPNVRWFDMGYNSGFARGNNYGIQQALNDYVLMINSDTLLGGDVISLSLSKYQSLEKEFNIGLLGCAIQSFDGRVLPSVHSHFHGISDLWKKNALAIKLLKSNKPPVTYNDEWYSKSYKAQHLSGAFLMFNKAKLNTKETLLDEDFFLYAEDVEWCYRLNKLGFEHYYYADAQIRHKDSASSTNSEQKILQITLSRWLFVFKARGHLYYYIYILLLFINLYLDKVLHNRKGRTTKGEFENESILQLLQKYWFAIPVKYKRATSSAKSFLKYVE